MFFDYDEQRNRLVDGDGKSAQYEEFLRENFDSYRKLDEGVYEACDMVRGWENEAIVTRVEIDGENIIVESSKASIQEVQETLDGAEQAI